MTDTEAEAMLVELAKHYRQPVLPLNRFCGGAEFVAERDEARRNHDIADAARLVLLAERDEARKQVAQLTAVEADLRQHAMFARQKSETLIAQAVEERDRLRTALIAIAAVIR